MTFEYGEFFRILITVVSVALFVGLNGVVLVYVERKVAGHIQGRPGPFEVGPHGILQTVADALKLMGKQRFRPDGADPLLFWLAPLTAFVPVVPLFMTIPFGPNLTGMDVNLGLLLILAFSGINVLALCMAGWGSNNHWALMGAARSVAQSLGYETPMFMSLLAVVFTSGSLNLSQIVANQGDWPWQWHLFAQPLAFLIFFICSVAETNRAPFDLPEAESELTAGYHTEYSGMGFGLFFLAEYVDMVVVSSVATAVFLGGWKGPFLPGVWWFLGKMYALILLTMWLRWTFPRLRFDQLLNVNWKWLLPLSLINLTATAFFVKVF
ncbi:MAG: NADH-quinone oxidoreductase subunit NuoH [Deltaproteobacteria bacterium]